MRQLRPVGTQLSNLLVNLDRISPDFNRFFIGLNRLIPASRKGLPAQSRFLDQTRNVLAQLDPFLRNFNPFLSFLGQYKREIAAMLATDTATTQATDQIGQDRVHYLRLTSPVNAESLATYPSRQDWFRGNPYYKPGTYDQLRGGLPVFDSSNCGPTPFPTIPSSPYLAEEFRNRIVLYVLNGGNTVAPPCREQGPFTESGESSTYPHVRTDPQPSP
jgi:phospholipid/cholesterol/gamma-HCH transport system substrate-binding protein